VQEERTDNVSSSSDTMLYTAPTRARTPLSSSSSSASNAASETHTAHSPKTVKNVKQQSPAVGERNAKQAGQGEEGEAERAFFHSEMDGRGEEEKKRDQPPAPSPPRWRPKTYQQRLPTGLRLVLEVTTDPF
jgi:hypothetical protein